MHIAQLEIIGQSSKVRQRRQFTNYNYDWVISGVVLRKSNNIKMGLKINSNIFDSPILALTTKLWFWTFGR